MRYSSQKFCKGKKEKKLKRTFPNRLYGTQNATRTVSKRCDVTGEVGWGSGCGIMPSEKAA